MNCPDQFKAEVQGGDEWVNNVPFFFLTDDMNSDIYFYSEHSVHIKERVMAKKREIILKTATILFAEKGFNETAISELAQMTNSAEGTIYYHFKTKTELFLATLEGVKEGIFSNCTKKCKN